MSLERRKRPQKALTRKDFRYKREWKDYKENEQEENEFEEFEEDEVDQWEAGMLLLVGLFASFSKMIELGGSTLGNPLDNFDVFINNGLGFLAIAAINAAGETMKGAESNKVQITSTIFKAVSYFAFAGLFFHLLSSF